MSIYRRNKRGKKSVNAFLELRKARLMMEVPGAWKIDFEAGSLWSGPVRVRPLDGGLYHASLHWNRERYGEVQHLPSRPSRRDPNEAVADAIKQMRDQLVTYRVLIEDAENSIVGGNDWAQIASRDKAEDDAVKKEFDKIARMHAKNEETSQREDEFAAAKQNLENRIEDLRVQVLEAEGESARYRELYRQRTDDIDAARRVAEQAKETARKAKNELRKRLKENPSDEAEGEPASKPKKTTKRRSLALR